MAPKIIARLSKNGGLAPSIAARLAACLPKDPWTTFEYGIFLEAYASLWLLTEGYSLRATRLKSYFGEVDLVAEKNKVLHLIEIKSLPKKSFGHHRVSQKQIQYYLKQALWISRAQKIPVATWILFVKPGDVPSLRRMTDFSKSVYLAHV